MRNRFDSDHILSICKNIDTGIFLPPMDAQTAVDELCRYFLGDDWYDTSGTTNSEQINTIIVCEIENNYKGAKIKHKK